MIKLIYSYYNGLKKYLNNTLWIMGDKFIGLGLSFIVTVLLARHLGPSDYGTYSYVMSMVSLFAVAGHMGLSGLVTRELVKNPKETGLILGTTLGLKFIGMVVGYIGLLIYAYLYEGFSSQEFLLITIAGTTLLLSCTGIIDYWFQSFVKAKYVSIASLTSLIISAMLKLALIFMGLGLTYFVITNVIQSIVLGLLLIIFYKKVSTIPLKSWSFSKSKAIELLSQSWLVFAGSIFAILNLKIDQVMLKWYQGAEQVGIYAVAAQLSEAWYFIPSAIVASFFPKLIQLKNENNAQYFLRLQQLFSALFLVAFSVAIVVSLGGDLLIRTFFGVEYLASSDVLTIHIWAAIFIFMRALFSRWILIENALVFSLITQAFGALVNILLNYFWINEYGVIGAAYATLISYASSSFFALIFYEKTRPIFWMMCKAMLLHSLIYKRPKNETKS